MCVLGGVSSFCVWVEGLCVVVWREVTLGSFSSFFLASMLYTCCYTHVFSCCVEEYYVYTQRVDIIMYDRSVPTSLKI